MSVLRYMRQAALDEGCWEYSIKQISRTSYQFRSNSRCAILKWQPQCCTIINVLFSFNSMDRLVRQIDWCTTLKSMKKQTNKLFFLLLVDLGSSQTIRMDQAKPCSVPLIYFFFVSLNKIRRFYGLLKCLDHYSIDDNGDDQRWAQINSNFIWIECNIDDCLLKIHKAKSRTRTPHLQHQSQKRKAEKTCIYIIDNRQSAFERSTDKSMKHFVVRSVCTVLGLFALPSAPFRPSIQLKYWPSINW